MIERRQVPRQKSLLRGRVYFNNRNSSADCLIRDISSAGARVVFANPVTLPDLVDLFIPQKEQMLQARIIWRHGNEIGLAFENAEQAAQQPDSGALPARVQKLEEEIVSLKRMLKRLKTEMTPGGDAEVA